MLLWQTTRFFTTAKACNQQLERGNDRKWTFLPLSSTGFYLFSSIKKDTAIKFCQCVNKLCEKRKSRSNIISGRRGKKKLFLLSSCGFVWKQFLLVAFLSFFLAPRSPTQKEWWCAGWLLLMYCSAGGERAPESSQDRRRESLFFCNFIIVP